MAKFKNIHPGEILSEEFLVPLQNFGLGFKMTLTLKNKYRRKDHN